MSSFVICRLVAENMLFVQGAANGSLRPAWQVPVRRVPGALHARQWSRPVLSGEFR
jgi:hypothetical protein